MSLSHESTTFFHIHNQSHQIIVKIDVELIVVLEIFFKKLKKETGLVLATFLINRLE